MFLFPIFTLIYWKSELVYLGNLIFWGIFKWISTNSLKIIKKNLEISQLFNTFFHHKLHVSIDVITNVHQQIKRIKWIKRKLLLTIHKSNKKQQQQQQRKKVESAHFFFLFFLFSVNFAVEIFSVNLALFCCLKCYADCT